VCTYTIHIFRMSSGLTVRVYFIEISDLGAIKNRVRQRIAGELGAAPASSSSSAYCEYIAFVS
jgi:hypothetical protein